MRRQNSSGSRRSRRSIGPQSPREPYGRPDTDGYSRQTLEPYREQSATDTDDSDIDGIDDGGFDVEALFWRQQEIEIKLKKQQEQILKRQQEEMARAFEEMRRKEEEAKKREEEAKREAEEAKRKQ